VGDGDTFRDPALSPDGRLLTVQRYERQDARSTTEVIDLRARTAVRLKADADVNHAIWSPDSRELIVGSGQPGKFRLSRLFATGDGEHVVLEGNRSLTPRDWSADGRFVAFDTPTATTGYDIWMLELTAPPTAHPYLQSRFNEKQARFSPDGRWVAYTSNESGQYEVYIEPFRRTGDRWRVSANGGEQPAWRPDGHELYYLSATQSLMATRVVLEDRVKLESPEVLFDFPFNKSPDAVASFIVAEDGSRFLVNAVTTSNRSPINTTVVVNGVRLADR
jgi:Tol biopolymer transport system component